MATVAVVIVTCNAEQVIEQCLRALTRDQQHTLEVHIVDSGSTDTGYLEPLEKLPAVTVRLEENIGFSRANNVGYGECSSKAEYILFLNPDAFVRSGTIDAAVRLLASKPRVGCLGGRLLGYDVNTGQPTGRLDSTGVFRTWYGRWFDRDQGEADTGQRGHAEEVPAACGAFMFMRREALEEVQLEGGAVFDPAFFLYKEDIELSLRLRKKGWKILYAPELEVYHCRGWSRQRSRMAYHLRESAARNEVLLYMRHPSVYVVWAVLKYLCVRGLRL